jgi:hypothetical protein
MKTLRPDLEEYQRGAQDRLAFNGARRQIGINIACSQDLTDLGSAEYLKVRGLDSGTPKGRAHAPPNA